MAIQEVDNKRKIRELKKEGFKDGPTQIGFCLPSLKNGQLVYSIIYQINNELQNTIGINITLFTENTIDKCFLPKCTVLNSMYMIGFTGHLIFISYDDLKTYINKAQRCKKYLYLYDFKGDKENIVKNENNLLNSVKIFTRSQNYYDSIVEKCQIHKTIVPNADIPLIMEIINEG